MEVRIVEDTDRVHHLVLPPRPTEDELSEEQLAQIGAGMQYCSPAPPPHCYCNCAASYCHTAPKDSLCTMH